MSAEWVCRNCGSNCFGIHRAGALCLGHHEFNPKGSLMSDGTYCNELIPSDNLEYIEWKYDRKRKK